MTFKHETVHLGAAHPGTDLEILKSAAGFYLGFRDLNGLPYSRESAYFRTRQEAFEQLEILKRTGRSPYLRTLD